MLKPRALRPGDRLAIVAPASSFDRNEFEQGIAEIERLGFVPVYDDTVFAKLDYTAGPADLRAAAIRTAWCDPSIAGIVAVRGGYGSAQVLPLLHPAEARVARKPFVGYSDLTAMLTFLTTWNDFFWPILALNSQNPTVQVAFQSLATGYAPQQSIIMAGTLYGTVPVLIVFALLGRQIVGGIMSGAVKG